MGHRDLRPAMTGLGEWKEQAVMRAAFRVRRQSPAGQFFRVQGRVKDGAFRAAASRSPKAILDAVLNLGIKLRQAIDGEMSISGRRGR
jgi:hypothetical protein